jgi:hypothetical protein
MVMAILLVAESGIVAWAGATTPLIVRVGPPEYGSHGFSVQVSVTLDRPYTIPVHASLLAGVEGPSPVPAFFFLDSSYRVQFGDLVDATAVLDGVQSDLSAVHSATSLTAITGSEMPSILASHPTAALVIAEFGVLPSTVFSNSTNLLTPWIAAGGTLIWAGGPLGYYSVLPDVPAPPSGCSPCWLGQQQILGYPLVDPSADRFQSYPSVETPLIADQPTAIASALGLQYNGTPFAANVSELDRHGGFAIGDLTDPATDGQIRSPVTTSLAYIPLGLGRIYYFGGAEDAGPATIPREGPRLISDIFTLLTVPYMPVPGIVLSDEANLPGDGTTAEFTLATANWTEGVILVVYAQTSGVDLSLFSQTLILPQAAEEGPYRHGPIGRVPRIPGPKLAGGPSPSGPPEAFQQAAPPGKVPSAPRSLPGGRGG